jgi:hypothetical protein
LKNKLYDWQVSKKIIAPEIIYAFFENNKLDTYQYLKSFEAALPSKMKVQYLTCKKDNEIVAITFLQQFRFSAFTIKETNAFKKLAIRFFFNIIPCHFSYCGSLFCIALPGMAFKNNTSDDDKAGIIDALVSQHGSTVTVIKDIRNKNLFSALSKEDTVFPISSDSTMELNMHNHWKSFDDYLADLQHKYRQKAKKVIGQFEAVQVKDLSLAEVIVHKNKIYELYLNVLNKQTFRLGMVEENYFVEMKKGLKNNFIVTGYFLNNELIAFRTAFLMEDRMEIHFIGFDYETNKNLQIYFNILYDNIKLAIEKNVQVLELGRTAQDAKRLIGALPKQFDDAIYFKSSFFKKAFEFLYARYNNNDNNLPIRNPFKPTAEIK